MANRAAGERGPKGDHGEVGETGLVGKTGEGGQAGQVGERGDSGHRGVAGERGPKGDHGQDGLAGPPGKTEPQTIWFGINRWTYAGLAFLFIVASGAYSTYKTDQRFQDQVDRVEQASVDTDYRTCLGGNKIRTGIRNVINTAYEEGPRRDAALAQFVLRDCDSEFPTRSVNPPLPLPTP